MVLWILFVVGCTAQSNLPECEWCGATEAPGSVSWETTIAPKGEPGEWMTIAGRVLKSDGKTPAPEVIIYVYHTNDKGYYEKKGNETGNGRRHGYLRGWMKTNANGEYRFTTIKPKPYPNRSEPAHVHVVVKEPGRSEYSLESYVFDDDVLLTQAKRAAMDNRGGSGIMKLKKNENGMLEGWRDLTLVK